MPRLLRALRPRTPHLGDLAQHLLIRPWLDLSASKRSAVAGILHHRSRCDFQRVARVTIARRSLLHCKDDFGIRSPRAIPASWQAGPKLLNDRAIIAGAMGFMWSSSASEGANQKSHTQDWLAKAPTLWSRFALAVHPISCSASRVSDKFLPAPP